MSSLTFQIRTRWIPLVNGDAEKGNKYVSADDGCGVCPDDVLLNFALSFCCGVGELDYL